MFEKTMVIFIALSVCLQLVLGLPDGSIDTWMKNKFCTGQSEYLTLPWDCSGYLHCGADAHAHWMNCPVGQKFDVNVTTCKLETNTCEDPEKAAETYCPMYPHLLFAHPRSCSMYYNCSRTDPRPGLKKYEDECSWPNLFDHVNSVCREQDSQNPLPCTNIPNSPCDYVTANSVECQSATDDSCAGLPNGLNVDPVKLALFFPNIVMCFMGKVSARFTCNAGIDEVFDVGSKTCTTNHALAIKNFCGLFPTATFADPDNCAMYYDCSAKQHHNIPMKDHLTECTYIHLYDPKTKSCMRYNETITPCGTRKEPLKPCEYRLSDCQPQSPCFPCSAVCVGLDDGANVYPGYEYTRFYLICEGQRTLAYKKCQPPQIFLPGRRTCGNRGDDVDTGTNTSADHCIGSRQICAADLKVMQQDMTELSERTDALALKVNEKLPDPFECVTPPEVLNSVMQLSYTPDSAHATYTCKDGFMVCGDKLVSTCSSLNEWSEVTGKCTQSLWTEFSWNESDELQSIVFECPFKAGSVLSIRGRYSSQTYSFQISNSKGLLLLQLLTIPPVDENSVTFRFPESLRKEYQGINFHNDHEWTITINKNNFKLAVDGKQMGVHEIEPPIADLETELLKLIFLSGFYPTRVEVQNSRLPYDYGAVLNFNLAYKKRAKSSSSEAELATDGDSGIFWSDDTCWMYAGADPNPWWQVDLEQEFYVTHVVISTPDCPSESCATLHDISISVSVNGDVGSLTEQDICFEYTGEVPNKDVVNITCNKPMKGKYVTLLRTSKYPDQEDTMVVCEVEVYGARITPPGWTPFMCPNPPLLSNSRVIVEYTDKEAIATYTCSDKYGTCEETNTIRCNSETGWTTQPKPCIKMIHEASWGNTVKTFPICPLDLGTGIEFWLTPTEDTGFLVLVDKDAKLMISNFEFKFDEEEQLSIDKTVIKPNPFTKNKESHVVISVLTEDVVIEVDDVVIHEISVSTADTLDVAHVTFTPSIYIRKARILRKIFGTDRERVGREGYENIAHMHDLTSSSNYNNPPSVANDLDLPSEEFGLYGSCWRPATSDRNPWIWVDLEALFYIMRVEISLTNLSPGKGAKNMAEKKPTFGSTDFDDKSVPLNAVDGDKNQDYNQGSCFFSTDMDAWWMVDLQGSYLIKTVVLYGRTDAMADRFKDITVLIYDKNPETDDSAVETVCTQKSGQLAPKEVLECTVPMRGAYVKVKKTSASDLALCEVEVYAELQDRLHDFEISVYNGHPLESTGKLCFKYEGEVTGDTISGVCLKETSGRFVRLLGPQPETEDDLMTVCEMKVYVDEVHRRWSPKGCPKPPSIEASEYVVTYSSRRAIATYTCDEDYTRFYGEDTVYCSSADGWDGEPGNCVKSYFSHNPEVNRIVYSTMFRLGEAIELMFTPTSESSIVSLRRMGTDSDVLKMALITSADNGITGIMEAFVYQGTTPKNQKILESRLFKLNTEVKIVVTFLSDSYDIAVNNVYFTSMPVLSRATTIRTVEFLNGILRHTRHIHSSETIGVRGPLRKENLILGGRPIYASSKLTKEFQSTNVFDGDLDTTGPSCWVPSASDLKPFIVITLNTFYYIDHVAVTTRTCTGECGDGTHDVLIHVYHEDPLEPIEDPMVCAYREGIIPAGITETISCKPGARGRYVVLYGKNRQEGDMFSFCEIQIYGGKIIRNRLPQHECRHPVLIPNAEVSVTYTETKALARYTCFEGFLGCGGSQVLQCAGTHGWMGTPWNCVESTYDETSDAGIAEVFVPCTFRLGRALELYFTPDTTGARIKLTNKDGSIEILVININVLESEGAIGTVTMMANMVGELTKKTVKTPLFMLEKEAKIVVTFMTSSFDVQVDDHYLTSFNSLLKPSTLYAITTRLGRLRKVRVIPHTDTVGVKGPTKQLSSKGVSASTVLSDTDPDSIYDNDLSTFWSSEIGDKEPYLLCYLRGYYSIESVVLSTRPCTGDCKDGIYDVLISVFHDETSEPPEICIYHEGEIRANTKETLDCQGDVRGAIVKVEGKNRRLTDALAFAEIDFFGREIYRSEWNPRRCPKPPLVRGAGVSVSYTKSQAIATYTCSPGFSRCNGKGEIYCSDIYGWDGLPGTCEEKTFPWMPKYGYEGVTLKCMLLLGEAIEVIYNPTNARSELQFYDYKSNILEIAFLPITDTRKESSIELFAFAGATVLAKEVVTDVTFHINNPKKVVVTFLSDNFDVAFEGRHIASFTRTSDPPRIKYISPTTGILHYVRVLPASQTVGVKSPLLENIALTHDEATSSSVPNEKFKELFAFDGKLDLEYTEVPVCWESDSNDATPYVQVKLNNYYYIDRMVLWARICPDGCGERLHDVYAEVYYKDPETSDEVPQPCFFREEYIRSGSFMSFSCDVRGRYVRVWSNKRNAPDDRLTVCELQLFGGKILRQPYPPFDCPNPPVFLDMAVAVAYSTKQAVATYKCIDGYDRCDKGDDGVGSDVMHCTGFDGWAGIPEPCVMTTFIQADKDTSERTYSLPCQFRLGQSIELLLTPMDTKPGIFIADGDLIALMIEIDNMDEGKTSVTLSAATGSTKFGIKEIKDVYYPIGKEIRVVITFLTGGIDVAFDGASISFFDADTDPSYIKYVVVNGMPLRRLRIIPVSESIAVERALPGNLGERFEVVTASSSDDSDPKAVVDGDLNTEWFATPRSCWASAINDMDPLIQIKLDDFYFVDCLKVTTRSDCVGDCADRTHDVLVTVFHLDEAFETPQTCFYREGAIPAGTTETINCKSRLRGRYVKLEGKKRRNTKDLFTICEIEVFGGELIIEKAVPPPALPVDLCPTADGYISVESPRLCFKLSSKTETASYAAAETSCGEAGRLIDLDTAEKYDYMINSLTNLGAEAHDDSSSVRIWVGLKMRNGVLKWASGSTYIQWDSGQPDGGQQCGQLALTGLSDLDCDPARRYICEIPMSKPLP